MGRKGNSCATGSTDRSPRPANRNNRYSRYRPEEARDWNVSAADHPSLELEECCQLCPKVDSRSAGLVELESVATLAGADAASSGKWVQCQFESRMERAVTGHGAESSDDLP